MWTLMIVAISGGIFSGVAVVPTVPMTNRAACEVAGQDILKNSNGVALLCISHETGEIVRFKK